MGEMVGIAAGGVVLVVLIGLIAVGAGGARKRITEALAGLARKHGLTFTDGTIERTVAGEVDGRPVHLRIYIKPRPNGRVYAQDALSQAWRIAVRGQLPSGLGAIKNGMLRSATEGTRRVETGDATFDRKVFVEAHDPAAAAPFLTERRRDALRRLIDMKGLLYGGEVLFDKVGLETKTGVLETRFDQLLAIARDLDGE